MSDLYAQTEVVSDSDQMAIRDGRMYRAYTTFTLAPLTSKYVLIRTPLDKLTVFHGRYVDCVGARANMKVYVNPVFSAEGTPVTTKFNLNSTSLNTTTGMVYLDPTFSNKGIEVDMAILAGGNQAHVSQGSKDVLDFERIFPEGVYFLTEFTNIDNAASTDIMYKLIWEEVTK